MPSSALLLQLPCLLVLPLQTGLGETSAAASFSGTTGKPYIIQFKDGSEKPCGTCLPSALRGVLARQSL